MPRKKNKQVDVVANLTITLALSNVEGRIPIYRRWAVPTYALVITDDYEQVNHVSFFEVEKEDWQSRNQKMSTSVCCL